MMFTDAAHVSRYLRERIHHEDQRLAHLNKKSSPQISSGLTALKAAGCSGEAEVPCCSFRHRKRQSSAALKEMPFGLFGLNTGFQAAQVYNRGLRPCTRPSFFVKGVE